MLCMVRHDGCEKTLLHIDLHLARPWSIRQPRTQRAKYTIACSGHLFTAAAACSLSSILLSGGMSSVEKETHDTIRHEEAYHVRCVALHAKSTQPIGAGQLACGWPSRHPDLPALQTLLRIHSARLHHHRSQRNPPHRCHAAAGHPPAGLVDRRPCSKRHPRTGHPARHAQSAPCCRHHQNAAHRPRAHACAGRCPTGAGPVAAVHPSRAPAHATTSAAATRRPRGSCRTSILQRPPGVEHKHA